MAGPRIKSTPRPKVSSPRVKPPRARPPEQRSNSARVRARTKVSGPTRAEKRKAVELKAERATRNKLYRMGYQSVRRMQHNKLHGIDLAAFKHDKRGRATHAAAVEVKGRSGRTPGPTAFKKQVRESYVMPRIAKAQQKGVKGADDLYRLAKENRLARYGSTYGLADKGKGPKIYQVPRRGPIPKKPI